jgi:hypothetical protein
LCTRGCGRSKYGYGPGDDLAGPPDYVKDSYYLPVRPHAAILHCHWLSLTVIP